MANDDRLGTLEELDIASPRGQAIVDEMRAALPEREAAVFEFLVGQYDHPWRALDALGRLHRAFLAAHEAVGRMENRAKMLDPESRLLECVIGRMMQEQCGATPTYTMGGVDGVDLSGIAAQLRGAYIQVADLENPPRPLLSEEERRAKGML